MDFSTYDKERLTNQIDWYDKKSQKEKKYYCACKVLALLFSASIPVLASFVLRFHYILTVISVFSALITFLEGLSSLKKFHDNWIQYRFICETLKRERQMYLYSAGIYDDPDTDKLKTLIERCESLISSENINWTNMNNNEKPRIKSSQSSKNEHNKKDPNYEKVKYSKTYRKSFFHRQH
ncbi:uncharacterized protein JF76_11110 [Lactobacillus kullabergensis]|uniref:DUF4231 domain-containing protein n=1 Tax=Lactobacillus kullabergensis TaxID=1218493 RepID=A0A0F4LB09_9LACO|nr:DUF4231 domain-containing protein [Lactobacillus kullabergensis]KJY55468.1 uncharacterized protein JF76_11110 [Lactobacillus kullabergensis]MBC6369465.1 DUF4231 domain-containing protein [Lactobacillus kullabergensis]